MPVLGPDVVQSGAVAAGNGIGNHPVGGATADDGDTFMAMVVDVVPIMGVKRLALEAIPAFER